MSGRDAEQLAEIDRQIREHESRVAEDLGILRRLREQWEMYGLVMRDYAVRIDEAASGEDPQNSFSQRMRMARSELDMFVRQVVREQAEAVDEAERVVRSQADAELDRLWRERASASWD